TRGAEDELVRPLVVEVDEAGVGPERLGDLGGDLLEHLLEVECRVDGGDRLGQQAQVTLGGVHRTIVGRRISYASTRVDVSVAPALPRGRRVPPALGLGRGRAAPSRRRPTRAAQRDPPAPVARPAGGAARRNRFPAHARARPLARPRGRLRLRGRVDRGRAGPLGGRRRARLCRRTAVGRSGAAGRPPRGGGRRAERGASPCDHGRTGAVPELRQPGGGRRNRRPDGLEAGSLMRSDWLLFLHLLFAFVLVGGVIRVVVVSLATRASSLQAHTTLLRNVAYRISLAVVLP